MNRPARLNDGRIWLRAPEPEDLDLLWKIENDTGIWPVSCNVMPYSRHQLAKYIAECSHDFMSDRQIRFIVCVSDDSTPVGCVDLTDIDPYNGRAEVGIALLPEFRGQGLATAALALLAAYAADTLHLHQLFAYVPADNGASMDLFLKAGFSSSGHLRDWLYGGDNYSDVEFLQKIL